MGCKNISGKECNIRFTLRLRTYFERNQPVVPDEAVLKRPIVVLYLISILLLVRGSMLAQVEPLNTLQNKAGLRLLAVNTGVPTLRVVLPGRAITDRTIEVLVPEHVTAVKQGSTAAEHLFCQEPGRE